MYYLCCTLTARGCIWLSCKVHIRATKRKHVPKDNETPIPEQEAAYRAYVPGPVKLRIKAIADKYGMAEIGGIFMDCLIRGLKQREVEEGIASQAD
jgi:hypothetical protein